MYLFLTPSLNLPKNRANTIFIARRIIKLLNGQGKTIAFQWVPSHVGIHGNETADLLAKKEPHFKTNITQL
jgi:ribonuclease HI